MISHLTWFLFSWVSFADNRKLKFHRRHSYLQAELARGRGIEREMWRGKAASTCSTSLHPIIFLFKIIIGCWSMRRVMCTTAIICSWFMDGLYYLCSCCIQTYNLYCAYLWLICYGWFSPRSCLVQEKSLQLNSWGIVCFDSYVFSAGVSGPIPSTFANLSSLETV